MRFGSIIHEGPSKPGRISGDSVNLRPSRVNESPFIRSDFRDGGIFILKGDATLKLDFSDPSNPKSTVGAPATSEDPRGVDAPMSIVFDATR